MQLAEQLWKALTSKALLIAVLSALCLLLLLSGLLPQIPSATADTVAYARWVAELKGDLGSWAEPLAAVQLLQIRTSLWLRLTLALLVLVVAARAYILITGWETLTRTQRWLQSALCAGAALFVIGWGLHTVWGWSSVEQLLWPDRDFTLPEHGLSLSPPARLPSLWTGRYGVYLLPGDEAAGLEVQALDADGQLLALQRSLHSEPQTTYRVALTRNQPDTFFALPTLGLIFRVNLQTLTPEPQLQLQLYRSASGELVAQTTIEKSGTIFSEDVRVRLDSIRLERPHVVYNPGAPLEALGLALLVIGAADMLRSKATPATAPDATEQTQTEE